MNRLLKTLWKDEAGFVLSSELILIATIVVLSVIVGLAAVSHSINSELNDVSNAFGSINQSYSAGANGSNMDNASSGSEIGASGAQAEAN